MVRGSESNVLCRLERAVEEYAPDIGLRVMGDCPLVAPEFIDASVEQIQTGNIDYVSAGFARTFLRGVTCEAFIADSFAWVVEDSSELRHREHVTTDYCEHSAELKLPSLESRETTTRPLLS